MRGDLESQWPCYVVAVALSATFAACSSSRLAPTGVVSSAVFNVAERPNFGFGYQVL
jgi:hypothetical protein